MARKKKGKLSGKIGNTIATSWKGEEVTKAHQPDVANPRTPAQVHNRMAFAAISSFCSLHKPVIKLGFQGHQNTYYPMNEARSVNSPKNTITGFWPDITIHYDRIKVASGLLPFPLQISSQLQDNRLIINWSGNEGLAASSTNDFLMVVLHYLVATPGFKQAVHHNCIAKRSDHTVTIPIKDRENNDFHAWAFFISHDLNADQDAKNVSESRYLGEFEF